MRKQYTHISDFESARMIGMFEMEATDHESSEAIDVVPYH